MLILLAIDTAFLKKKKDSNYTIQILMLSFLIALFSTTEVFLITVALMMVLLLIYMVISKIMNHKEVRLPIGFLLCISNISVIILQTFMRI